MKVKTLILILCHPINSNSYSGNSPLYFSNTNSLQAEPSDFFDLRMKWFPLNMVKNPISTL